MSDFDTTVQKAERIRCRREGDSGYLLYNPRTDQLHVIDERGKQIFDLCDGRAIDDVVLEGCAIDLPGLPSVTPDELLDFLCGLKRRDLVVMR